MTADPANTLANLIRAVGHAEGALLMALDGLPIEQATSAAGVDLESMAGEYADLLRQAQALAAELDCGTLRRFSVRATSHRIVFGFVPGDLVLGLHAGPASLCGQMRHAVAQAAERLGEL